MADVVFAVHAAKTVCACANIAICLVSASATVLARSRTTIDLGFTRHGLDNIGRALFWRVTSRNVEVPPRVAVPRTESDAAATIEDSFADARDRIWDHN
jgi:hypothetical protein